MPDTADRPDSHPDEPRRELTGSDLDAAFAEAIAGWDEPAPKRPAVAPVTSDGPHRADGPTGSGPGAPDAAPDVPPARTTNHPAGSAINPPRSPAGFVVPRVPDEGERQELFGVRSYTVPDVPDEFVPPPPAPMPDPESDPQFWAIVGCLVLGPALMILLTVTGRTSMTLLMALGGIVTAVGFALLVVRGGREERDPDDDGARV